MKPRREIGWLCVEPTLPMDAATASVRKRLGLPVLLAYAQGSPANWLPFMWKVLRGRFCAVLCQGWSTPAALGTMLACIASRTPYLVAFDTHSPLPGGSIIRRVGKALVIRPLLRRASALLPGGSPQARYGARLVAPRRVPTRVAPLTVDIDFFRSAGLDMTENARRRLRRSWGASNTDIVILYVGDLEKWKGIDTLLVAADRLSQHRRDVRFVAYGKGSLEIDLVRATQRGLPVYAGGHVDADLIAASYAAADVFVLPSIRDQWGLVVNEALAVGLPVVVSDAVGCREDLIEEGETGLSFPAGDAHALFERLVRLANDSTLREELGTSGSRRIDSWSLSRYAEVVVDSLSAVCSYVREVPPTR